jgi:hypothetical protein
MQLREDCEVFLDAWEAFWKWEDRTFALGEPEPTVWRYEIRKEGEKRTQGQKISISKACELVAHCNEIVPVQLYTFEPQKRLTYAEAALDLRAHIARLKAPETIDL